MSNVDLKNDKKQRTPSQEETNNRFEESGEKITRVMPSVGGFGRLYSAPLAAIFVTKNWI